MLFWFLKIEPSRVKWVEEEHQETLVSSLVFGIHNFLGMNNFQADNIGLKAYKDRNLSY